MEKEKSPVIIYTDGGCEPNPGTGGWAAVLSYQGKSKEISGAELETTNNRMELMAAIRALEALKRPCKVVIHTDSQYVMKGITEWIFQWRAKNWQRKTGPIPNADLWQRLDAVNRRHDVEWRWVRGHTGDPLNERCDELAGLALNKLRGR